MISISRARYTRFLVWNCICMYALPSTHWGFHELQQVSEFDLFTLDDIDSAFQNVTRLTNAQHHHLSGMIRCNSVLEGMYVFVLIYVVYRQRRGNCYLTSCGWASLGRYCMEDNKRWRRCNICCGLQPSKRKVTLCSSFNYLWHFNFVWVCIWWLQYINKIKLLTAMIFVRHLNGINQSSFVRPAVLITDAYNALNNQAYRRQKDREFTGTLSTQ